MEPLEIDVREDNNPIAIYIYDESGRCADASRVNWALKLARRIEYTITGTGTTQAAIRKDPKAARVALLESLAAAKAIIYYLEKCGCQTGPTIEKEYYPAIESEQ